MPSPRTIALRCTSLATALATPLLGGCIVINAGHSDRDRHEETRVIRLDSAEALDVELTTRFGDIDLAPLGTPLPRWATEHAPLGMDFTTKPGETLIVAVVGSHEEDRVAQARVEPTLSGDHLSIAAHFPEPRPKNSGDGVRYAIRAAGFDAVTLNSGFGDISVAHATGHAEINTDFGDVELVDHAGSAQVYTDFGDIEAVAAAGHHAPFSLETDYGDIEAIGVIVPLRAYSDYGSLDLEHIAGPIDAFTDYGAVDITLTEHNPGPLKVESDYGDVRIEFGPGFRGSLTARSDGDDVELKRFAGSGLDIRGDDDFASIRFTADPADSRVETGYGSVTLIRRPGAPAAP